MRADPRVVEPLRAQLRDWRAALDAGAERVGWKIGLNIPEVQRRLGLDEPVIGHLTSATQVGDGGTYEAGDPDELKAEPEVALELSRDVTPEATAGEAGEAIGGFAPAIELVDVGRPPADLESIVAANVFHRACALGSFQAELPSAEASVSLNGERRETAAVEDDFGETVSLVARLLGAAGEQLQAGDRIIAGSLTRQVAVRPGDEVTVELGELGRVSLRVA